MVLGGQMNREEVTAKNAENAKIDPGILFPKESYRIVGACFEVYKNMGCGFLEAVYQECLALEFKAQEIPFVEKSLLALEFKGHSLRQTYAPDFLCFGEIMVEIKSAKQLANDHRAQAVNYLKAAGKSLALLVNFGHHPGLEFERFVQQDISRISRDS